MASPRLLFISGSIGLGHAARDLAIAGELRRLDPVIEIDWLAGDPARRLIEDAGEELLPASAAFQETGVAEAQAEGFSLNIVGYLQHAAGAWVRAARTSLRAMQQRPRPEGQRRRLVRGPRRSARPTPSDHPNLTDRPVLSYIRRLPLPRGEKRHRLAPSGSTDAAP